MQRLLHDLEVHKLQLEMQNAELRAAQDEVLALETYSDLYDFAPIGYLTLDGNGSILRINFTAAELLGAERSLLISRRFSRFIAEKDHSVFADYLDKVKKTGVRKVCEVLILTSVATSRFVRIEAAVSHSGEEFRIALSDITEQKKAEKELRASRRLFRTLAQVVPVGIFRTDPSGECLYVNERWQKIACITEAEALGSGWARAIHPDDREAVSAEWSRCIHNKISFQMEYRFRRPDGAVTWVQGHSLAESDIHGAIVSFVGAITDITERKSIEDQLRASMAHLNEAQQLTKLGSWTRDYPRNTLHWSDEMFRITELEPAEFNDAFENYLYVVHPNDRSKLLQTAHDAHITQTPYELEYRLHMPDGRIKWVQSRGTANYDEHGQPLIMTGTTQDITDRKLSEESLMRSEGLLRLIIDSVPAGVSYVDSEGRFHLVNRHYEDKLYPDEPTFCGRHLRDVLSKSAWGVARPFMVRALAGEQVFFENKMCDSAGSERFFSVIYTPDRDDNGVGHGFVALVQDITERKQAELSIRSYSRRLVELEEEVRKKLAAELHDEMGPDLTALNFNLAFIRDSGEAEFSDHLAELVTDSGQLVNDLSDKVRNIITRLHPPVLFDYGLEAALRWYVDLMMKRTDFTIFLVTEGAVPRLSQDHELALFSITKEALINAAKYSGAKCVTVTIGCDGGTVQISVCDDGAGFDETAVARSDAGGWGLTIMRERTAMMGGTFRLKTGPGAGTTIHLEIPEESVDGD
jgi:PAS domain S-box-containing protein